MRSLRSIRAALAIATVLTLFSQGSDSVAGPTGRSYQAPSSFYFTRLGSGGGETETGSTSTRWIIYAETFTGAFAGAIEFGAVDLFQGDQFTVDLEANRQMPLQPGILYDDTSDEPFNPGGTPGNGLQVFDGMQDETLPSGEFYVRDAKYDSSGAIQSLAVDFITYESGSTLDWSFGSIRYQSTVPLTGFPVSLIEGLPASTNLQFRQSQGVMTSFR
jgi:hypothetical protein